MARNRAEYLNERVQYWSIGESVLIIILSMGQVFVTTKVLCRKTIKYLRTIFSTLREGRVLCWMVKLCVSNKPWLFLVKPVYTVATQKTVTLLLQIDMYLSSVWRVLMSLKVVLDSCRMYRFGWTMTIKRQDLDFNCENNVMLPRNAVFKS